MLVTDLIRRKRDGVELQRDEIEFLVNGYTRDEIPDYQMSAWLMAVLLRGMSRAELAALTETMLNSGQVLDFSELPAAKTDKHSTGGVGDKTSLIIAPIVAAGGLYVPMISGRGLGHTGGTLKPGMDSSLSSVPPVCPRPRPLIIGTSRPPAATIGAIISDVLSPTPPVECLSVLAVGRSEKSSTWPELSMVSVNAASSARDMPRSNTAISHADI